MRLPDRVHVTASDGTNSTSQDFVWKVAPITVTAITDQFNFDGDEVSFAVTAHYHGAGTLGFSATGLPDGLSINSATGVISGTVADGADEDGPFTVTVTASDGTNG